MRREKKEENSYKNGFERGWILRGLFFVSKNSLFGRIDKNDGSFVVDGQLTQLVQRIELAIRPHRAHVVEAVVNRVDRILKHYIAKDYSECGWLQKQHHI